MKAKRSLTSSFDHLLKRKNSKDDVAIAQKDQVTNKVLVPKLNVSEFSFKWPTMTKKKHKMLTQIAVQDDRASSNGSEHSFRKGDGDDMEVSPRSRTVSLDISATSKLNAEQPLKSPMMDM